jgi:hypothetical protein
MAGPIQNFLQDASAGFFGNEYLRDYTHASKTFRANAYGYAPKYKFLFHVYFDVNKSLISSTSNWPDDQNFGLAVKSIDLPKFTMDLATMNQYNRKRIVQTKIKYDPVNITFHDDNSNLIRTLWYTYYTYYYKDATQTGDIIGTTNTCLAVPPPPTVDLNKRTIYDPYISGVSDVASNDDWGYVGETGSSDQTPTGAGMGVSKAPFFRAINIYGFNQHNFVLYRLINPVIESFGHDTYNYSENSVMENKMGIQYETVKYYEGALDGKTPDDFVQNFGKVAHYDRTLSPIARPGSQSNILGPGGLVSAAGGIMTDWSNGNILGAIQKAGAAANTFKNPANILKIASAEVMGIATDALKGTPNRNTNFSFPAAGSSASSYVNSSITGVENTAGTGYTNPTGQNPPGQ